MDDAAGYETRRRALGDKGAGLAVLAELGLAVAPHRVVPTTSFERHRDALAATGGHDLPPALAAELRDAYAAVVHDAGGDPTVLVRGSLAVDRPTAGQTHSDMIADVDAALTTACRIYQRFLAAEPPHSADDAVAVILQTPSFHSHEITPSLLTGTLAVRAGDGVVEVCTGDDLSASRKWWNGTVGGTVSWAVDVDRATGALRWHATDRPTTGVVDDPAEPTPPQIARHLDTIRRVWSTGVDIHTHVGFDIDLEWVSSDRLYVHQLRPLGHSFATLDRTAQLTEHGGTGAFSSTIALDNGGAVGRLLGASDWPAAYDRRSGDGPVLVVAPVARASFPGDLTEVWPECAGIVDPTLGSRLSHFAARCTVPYIAVPGLRTRPGIPRDGELSDRVWEISPAPIRD